MSMPTRRKVLRWLAGLTGAGFATATYGFVIEPRFRLKTMHYALTPPGWTPGLKLRAAILTDIHVGEPYMGPERIRAIVDRANALSPDIMLLLGDFETSHRFRTRHIEGPEYAAILKGLRAPLGVHAVLGNHDWWEDDKAQRTGQGPIRARVALESVGIRVYENTALRIDHKGQPFWIAGLGDQLALLHGRGRRRPRPLGRTRWAEGVDDLPATMALITDNAPVILMAHEPDIFPEVPARVSLTLCGHTHGGQVRLFGYSPVVPSNYGNRYAYGHIVEEGRHMIVSAGLGVSVLPVRFGMPPEIALIDIG